MPLPEAHPCRWTGRSPEHDVLCRRARPFRVQHLGGGDRERRRTVLGDRHRRRHVWRVLRGEDISAGTANKRVLVLDAGRFLVSEHVQNLARIGLNVPVASAPASDPGVARELVWGMPWRGNVEFPGLAYCTGGKSIYWGGWCPRLTAAPTCRAGRSTHRSISTRTTRMSRARPASYRAPISSSAICSMCCATKSCRGRIGRAEHRIGDRQQRCRAGAAWPCKAARRASGLFSFDKYSSLPLLVEAIRDDVARLRRERREPPAFLVPPAHVVKLHTADGKVHTIEVDVDGQRKFLPVGPHCAVDSRGERHRITRLALHSFPTPLMGRNLMAHVRSDFTVRVQRSALPPVPAHVQTAALLVRGVTASGRFHLQVTASTHAAGSDELLFRMVPDIDILLGATR